jgi:hypothetical protein
MTRFTRYTHTQTHAAPFSLLPSPFPNPPSLVSPSNLFENPFITISLPQEAKEAVQTYLTIRKQTREGGDAGRGIGIPGAHFLTGARCTHTRTKRYTHANMV